MRKVLKVISSIVIIGLFIIGCYLGFIIISNKLKDIKLDNERKNSRNFMEYIKNHDYEHVQNSDEAMEYLGKNFKCDDIDNKNIITINDKYLVLDDYSIYEIVIPNSEDDKKMFSNNQSCKKIESTILIKGLKKLYSENYFVDNENNLYSFREYDKKLTKCGPYPSNCNNNPILYQKDISKIISYNNDYYYVLKTDGQIYKQKYKTTYNNAITEYILEQETLYLSSDKYGKILDASRNSLKNNIEADITSLVTEKGYYYLEEQKTDKCTKYEDIKCKIEFVPSNIYLKYRNDIKYVGENYTVLIDNTIIDTKLLQYKLDKDVK